MVTEPMDALDAMDAMKARDPREPSGAIDARQRRPAGGTGRKTGEPGAVPGAGETPDREGPDPAAADYEVRGGAALRLARIAALLLLIPGGYLLLLLTLAPLAPFPRALVRWRAA